jgi:hypothetical protein
MFDETKKHNTRVADGVTGSTKLYELKSNGPQMFMTCVQPQYDYDMNEIILEWVTITLMSKEVGWTLTPLISLVLSYLL